jgi:hypothetical protein
MFGNYRERDVQAKGAALVEIQRLLFRQRSGLEHKALPPHARGIKTLVDGRLQLAAPS